MTAQPDLFKGPGRRFAGPAYEPAMDDQRLGTQLRTIYDLMADGQWRSLRSIERITGYPSSSISAQLRHLRKARYGSQVVERKPSGDRASGLFVYRLLLAR